MPTVRTRTRLRRARARAKRKASLGGLSPESHRQISGVVYIGVALVLAFVLRGQGGVMGSVVDRLLTAVFGRGAHFFPVVLLFFGGFLLASREGGLPIRRASGLAMAFLAILGLMHIQVPFELIYREKEVLGGMVGFLLSFLLLYFTSLPVAYIVLSCLLLIGILVSFDVQLSTLLQLPLRLRREDPAKERVRSRGEEDIPPPDKKRVVTEGEEEEEEEKPESINIVRPAFIQGQAAPPKPVKREPAELTLQDTHFEHWEFPPLDILNDDRSEVMVDDETLKLQAKRIEEKLQEFGLDVMVRDALPGPTVTQFTIEPKEGVKLSRIETLKDDLSMALSAQSVRIEAPIPGKGLVGLELPNEVRTVVHLREILESPAFQQNQSSLSLPLGRGVSGDTRVDDLSQMPHLLIAGATGSGKSVCINTFLLSLLYQNAPHELKLILIDPKHVELMPYDGIPHLLTPVITQSEKALQALRWAVAEMQRRYMKLSDAGVRNITEFNDRTKEDKELLYHVVIVIDELADLMMRQYRRDTETMIARITQMARATGIHLIVATQRPSVDVITGLIKANMPSRIAFRTVTSIDSRTILDGIGAEDLLGRGDMLYLTATTPKPQRIQGIFVSTEEVERVINHVKIAGGGRLTEDVTRPEEGEGEEGDEEAGVVSLDLSEDDDGGDPLTFEVVEFVKETRQASATRIQRRFRIGYARAARLLDILEQKGIVGPVDGARPRKVFVE